MVAIPCRTKSIITSAPSSPARCGTAETAHLQAMLLKQPALIAGMGATALEGDHYPGQADQTFVLHK
jgi:hypothetical protein